MGWLRNLWRHGLTPSQRARSLAAERYVEETRAYERELAALPATTAREQAGHLLTSSRFIRAIAWDAEPRPLPQLAPGQQELFARFRRIEARDGDPHVDAAAAEPLSWLAPYVRLGTDGEHTHIVARPGAEEIFIAADDVPPNEAIDTTIPTIYHWVLWLHRTEELLAEPET